MAGKIWRRSLLWAGFGIALLVVGWMTVRPAAIPVETSRVVRGPMRVTVDEDGETRTHDRFVVAAPIPGRLLRVNLEEGDEVHANQIIARIEPLPLNQQEREEVLARIETAEATKREADARVEHAREDHEQAQRDLRRAEQLGEIISNQGLEQSRNAEITSAKEFEAARFNAQAAASEVNLARAGLVGMEQERSQPKVISVRAPVAGTVLHVTEKSEHVLQAGTAIAVVGDPRKIEIVTDVLTTDAVNIKPGAPVLLERWGGDHPLRAKVRLVEPSGFTKVSALGVEEKRVNVISDFVEPPNGLADGYRVETSILTWQTEDTVKVPGGAPFRESAGWGVFVVEGGKARHRSIKIGHRNAAEVEVLGGLIAGEQVILHPSSQLREGARVQVE